MKKTNKIVSLFLVVAMLSALVMSFVGCTPKADINLVVYNWEDYIDIGNPDEDRASVVSKFEKQYKDKTGKTIKVVYTTFDTNETMLTKMMKDDASVDLICPSEYAIEKLMRADKLSKIEKTDMPNYANINPAILGKVDAMFNDITIGEDSDKKNMNDYFVPYMMGTLGILYNKAKVSEEDLEKYGWGILWNAQESAEIKGKILMKDSIRDAYVVGLMRAKELDLLPVEYKGMPPQQLINTVDDTLISIVGELFQQQKAQLKGYEVDFGKDDMIKQVAYVDLAWSGDALYAIEEGADKGVELGYYVPHNEGNIWFDGWVIPKTSANKDAAKAFIDYMCDPEISMLNAMEIGYTSACDKDAILNSDAAKEVITSNDYTLDEFLGDAARYPEIVIDQTNPKVGDLGVMKDFGAETDKIVTMWEGVKAGGPNTTIYVILSIIILVVAVTLLYMLGKKLKGKKKKLVRKVVPAENTTADTSAETPNDNTAIETLEPKEEVANKEEEAK